MNSKSNPLNNTQSGVSSLRITNCTKKTTISWYLMVFFIRFFLGTINKFFLRKKNPLIQDNPKKSKDILLRGNPCDLETSDDGMHHVKRRSDANQLNILYYSPFPSHPISHGSYARIYTLGQKLQSLGHTVHFALLESVAIIPFPKIIEKMLSTQDRWHDMRNAWSSVNIIPSNMLIFPFPKAVPFDGWFDKNVGENVRYLCSKYNIDVVLCSYVFQSKLLEYVPDHILKVIDTHDKMANRADMLRENKINNNFFSCTPEDEGAYLRRADIVIGMQEEETRYFETISGQQNAITVSHIEEPKFLDKIFSTVNRVGIVASDISINYAMIKACLVCINEHLKQNNSSFSIHIAGNVKNAVGREINFRTRKLFKSQWVHLHGFVPDIAQFYSEMDLILTPVVCGTGINIKTVEAMAYGMPLLTTACGSKGIETNDEMHQHEDMNALVKSLFALQDKPYELERLSALSREKYKMFYEQNVKNLQAIFNHPKLRSAW